MITLFRKARFLRSVSNVRQLELSNAEVALVGRSNVGKSSLLNALCCKYDLAKTSKTPGRTRLINIYAIERNHCIVDLPGYGFADGPAVDRVLWKEMVEGYLMNRCSIRIIYVLVDARIGPTRLDYQMMNWLMLVGLRYRIVVTKCDQVKLSQLGSSYDNLFEDAKADNIFFVSSRNGMGICALRLEIARMLMLY